MDIKSILAESDRLEEEHADKVRALCEEATKDLGATVLGMNRGEVHIYEPEFVAAIPEPSVKAWGNDYYRWRVEAKSDGVCYYALMTDAQKEELGL